MQLLAEFGQLVKVLSNRREIYEPHLKSRCLRPLQILSVLLKFIYKKKVQKSFVFLQVNEEGPRTLYRYNQQIRSLFATGRDRVH